ncbi:MAG: SRPBCC domain-containing protein [Usitatibacter sp.]
MKTLLLLLGLATSTEAGADERRIFKEAVVQAPVEAVWKAWTTAEGIQSFFAPEAVVDARPDGEFSIHINPYAPPGLKGADDMRVMAVQENQLLSFTWNAPPHLAEARKQRTFVTIRLQPAGSGTLVRLHHSGWGEGGQWDQAYDYFDKAWASVLEALQKRFVEGPRDWTAFRTRMKAYQEEEDRRKRR